MSIWIKACPKCGGDLYSDRDVMGYYRQCLQCGYTFYEQRRRPECDQAVAATPLPPPERAKTNAQAGSGRRFSRTP